jgi:hypothetical protein
VTTKRITWKEGDLVSLKLKDDLYTIAQMLRRPYMRFFDLSTRDGQWKDVDLNQVKVLFSVLVGNVVLQELGDGKIKDKSVKPSQLPFEKRWIRPRLNFEGGSPFKGGDLVDVDPNVGYVHAPIIKENLSIARDPDVIAKHELVNMWGARDLAERLVRYFETGRDHNPMKEKVFGTA